MVALILPDVTEQQKLTSYAYMNAEGITWCGKPTAPRACVCTFICIVFLKQQLLEREKQLVLLRKGRE